MPEIIAGLFVFTIVIGGLVVAYRTVTAPTRADAAVRSAEAHEAHAVNGNHQDLFLIVERLIGDNDRGLNTPFLTADELTKARTVCATYRNEISK